MNNALKKALLSVFVLYSSAIFFCYGQKPVRLVLLETTDVHGMVMPFDYIEKKKSDASLAGVEGYIKKEGFRHDEMILLDNGDNLQGQPAEYYFNFIDTVSRHLNSAIMNFMNYDACTVGNHDIETGHRVYDRVRKEYRFPLLAANAVDVNTGKPYFEPYTILKRNGLKIIVFGLVTPSIPDWLPLELYRGMEFTDMVEAAKKWMPVMKAEKPDLIVGLFHSGWDKNYDHKGNNYHPENGTAAVAYNVPGFDVIFAGHDHNAACEKIVNIAGDTVLVIDGGSHAQIIGRADVLFKNTDRSGRKRISVSGEILSVREYKPDSTFLAFTVNYDKTIMNYVDKVIGSSTATVSSRDSYFGSSSFTDLIHRIQLELTGADISFAAPLSFDVEIPEGKITVGDMFKLYRFENMLYTMKMTGSEIKNYLEFSYGGWLNTMTGPADHLIAFRLGLDGNPVMSGTRARLKNQPYNFDSAAGIDYTVDVSKPAGDRIRIKGLSDGRPFEEGKSYRVAVNSYRGNGGGGHFFEGAGIGKDELRRRIIASTDKDLRYYMLKYIEKKGTISPAPFNNWKIIPESWALDAGKKDYILMFGTQGVKK